ncbi:hypothetical protein DPX16_19955 [Anabarilius grahami]|uniref:PiggyBac transposable element-derived protein domain-containing protein n=1 Tax=Anabarilius grahami TaxID=495550 RepID=A0A3N0YIY9_ANAGA|nr:hypothetical protein DPX16_19955 [Anabarilius grahami]
MKRSYSTEEALKLVLPTEAENEELSSEDDVEFELESDPSDSSCSSDESTESEHMEDTAHSQWNSKNGQIVWSSTHAETLRYCPAKGITPDYNRCKGGVDNLDKVVGTYSCRRRTCRWPVVLFYNLVDVSTFNSFVLWTAVDPSWNQGKTFRRRLFLEELGKMPQISRRQRIPRQPSASTMVKDQQQENPNTRKRKFCKFCTDKKKKVASICKKCGKHICKVLTLTYCTSCCE